MLISRVLAWVSVALTAITAIKFLARISKIKPLNRFFRKIHIPSGIILLITSAVHGIIAGNPPGVELTQISFFSELFSLNWGTAAFVCIVLLAVVYLIRKLLSKKWMPLHRVLTVIMIVTLVLHLFETGVLWFDFGNKNEHIPTQAVTQIVTEPGSVDAESTITSAPDDTEEPTEPETDAPVVTFSGAVLADGTYSGSAQGYHGDIYVSVTVENSQVTDITVTDNYDTPRYFSQAMQIIDRIEYDQSLEVDAVTGATYSSEGIRNAVYNALQQAVVSGAIIKK